MCKRIFANQTCAVGDVPFYKIGTLGTNADSFISNSLFSEYKEKYNYPQKGETLLTCSGTVGKCVQFDGEPSYYQDSNIVWLRGLKSPISHDFLFRLLKQNDWSKLNTTTISRIYSSDLLSLSFNYPPTVEEQAYICSFLELIDKQIETQNKIIKELETLKNAILDKIINLSYSNGTKKIDKIIVEYCNKTKTNNEYPVLSSTASGIFFQSDYFKKEASSEDTTGYKCIPFGYCTYRSMSDTGKFNFNIQNITDIGIVSPAYPVFFVKEVSALFLITVLNNDKKVINDILKMKTGGTRFSLPLSKLMKLEIPWPQEDKRKIFTKIIEILSEKISIENKTLIKYKEQKDYLLQNMFI